MTRKVKLTVSIDAELAKELRTTSRGLRRATSHLVEEALRLWRRRRLDEELRKGYAAMSKEDLDVAESTLAAQREALE